MIARTKQKNGIELTEYDRLVLEVQNKRRKPPKKESTDDLIKSDKPKVKRVRKKKKKKKPKVSSFNKKMKWACKLRDNLIENITPHEKIVQDALISDNLKHSFQDIQIVKDEVFILDFYFTTERLCVEIDGFHHYHEPQKSIDRKRTKLLKTKGIKVIRFNNDEVDKDLHLVICTIKKELGLL